MAAPIVLEYRSNPTVFDVTKRAKVQRRFVSGQSSMRPGPRKCVGGRAAAATDPRPGGARCASLSGRVHAVIASGFCGTAAVAVVRQTEHASRRGSMALAIGETAPD